MVKYIIYVTLFLLLSNVAFGQKASKITTIKLTKEEMKTKKLLSDIIKDIPADCEVKSYKYSIVIKGMEKTGSMNNGAIESWLRDGTAITFFVEQINSSCPSKHKAKYKIVVE